MKAYWRFIIPLALVVLYYIACINGKALDTFVCPELKFKCKNDRCIPNIWKCDGDDDCGDGSDESGSCRPTCRAESEFSCAVNGKCIPQRWRCDSEKDCDDGSDEENCPKATCKPNFFQCNNTRCVPERWKCDKQDDCGDKSDEQGCGIVTKTCEAGEFRCTDGICIIKKWECDGETDCADGVDERNCSTPAPMICNDKEYKCKTGQCIKKDWRCDGNIDCTDQSDEDGCENVEVKNTCGPLFWRCDDGNCIKKGWKCDGENDCVDGSDEKSCNHTECEPGSFKCRDGHHCVRKEKRCDGKDDCADKSDEKHCATSKVNCTRNDFNCSTSECVSTSQVCDGRNDCLNGADEPHDCNINECLDNNGHCSHICADMKISYKCSCPKGYELDTDKRTCKDIDECQIFGMCHQKCANVKGHYKCSCAKGYEIEQDHKTCKPEGNQEWVYFSNRVDIRKITPDGKQYSIIARNLRGVVSLDFHVKKNHIYWTDILDDKIQRTHVNADYNTTATTIRENVHTADGLAIDWINDKLYWTDTGYKTIEVSELDGSNNMDVVDVGLNEPRAIGLDPHDGFIYWTDWGSNAAIEKISMDGDINTRKILVDKNVYWPNGMTLDLIQRKLYWIDAKLKRVEAINFDGSNRMVIKQTGFYHPFALDSFNNELYWTDWKSDKLSRVSKFDPDQVNIIKAGLFAPMGIKVFHKSRQPDGVNRCKNHECSHLCLLANHGDKPSYACKCPRNMVLRGNKCEGTSTDRTAAPPTVPPTVPTQSNTPKTGSHTTPNSVKPMKVTRESPKSNVGTVVAIVLSIVLAIGLICLIVWYVRRRNLSKGNVMYYKDMSSTPLEEDFDIQQDDFEGKVVET